MFMRVRLILAFLSGAYVSLLVANIAHLATVGCGAHPRHLNQRRKESLVININDNGKITKPLNWNFTMASFQQWKINFISVASFGVFAHPQDGRYHHRRDCNDASERAVIFT
jgi:hypothetical protein